MLTTRWDLISFFDWLTLWDRWRALMLIDIFLLLLIQLLLLQRLQFSSDFSSSSNAPPSNSYRPSGTFQRTSLSTRSPLLPKIPTSFSPNFSHSINDHVDKIKPLLLGVHFSSPPPTCQIFSCLSRSIRPQIVPHMFYLVSLTHTSISNLKSYTCMKLPSIN